MALQEQLIHLCRRFPVQEKGLLVPQRQFGGTLLGGLSRMGEDWFNVRVCTLDELLKSLLGLEEPSAAALFPFWEVSRNLQPEVLATLDRLLCDGAEVERIAQVPHPVKRRYLEDALAVSQEMQMAGQRSRAAVYREALAAVESASRLEGLLVVFGSLEVSPIEAQLLRALKDKGLQVEILEEPGPAIPGTASAALRPHPAQTQGVPVETAFIRAVSPESEVYAVLQTIQEHGMALEDVEVVLAKPKEYRDVLVSAFRRANVPLSVSLGTPVGHTRVGQLVRALGRLVTDRQKGLHPLLNLLRSGFSPRDVLGIDNAKASQRLSPLMATAGFVHPPDAFLRLLAGKFVDNRSLSFDEALQKVKDIVQDGEPKDLVNWEDLRLYAGLRDWYRGVPLGSCSFGQLVKVMQAWLTRVIDQETRRGEASTERSAYNRVLSRLRTVETRVGVETVSPEAGMETLLTYLLQGSVEGEMPKAGCVHVVDVPFAGLSARPYRFVLGLDDGVRWSTRAEDRWLTRSDRAVLGAEGVDAEDRAKQVAVRALNRPCARRFLSYAMLNLADSSELAPSPVYLEALRTTFGSASEAILTDQTRFVDLLPGRDRAFHANDQHLAAPDAKRLEADFPQTVRGVNGHAERKSDAPSEFNGTLGLALDPKFDPFGTPGKPTSATRLNLLVQSGFASFLRDVLQVRLSEEDQMRDAEWPTALHKGSAVHTLLKQRVDQPSEDPAQVLNTFMDTFIQRWPPPNDEAKDTFRAYLERILYVFDALEKEVPPGTEKHTEVKLEESPEKSIDLQLRDDLILYLSGSIDRLDFRSGKGSVIDYKTGKGQTFIENKDWLKVGELQWALYALAASRKFERPVTQAGYLLLSEEVLGLRLMKDVPEKETLAEILHDARGWFMSGNLTHTDKAVPLKYAPESWVRPPQKNVLPDHE